MGLLFVFSDDDTATGHHVNIALEPHGLLIAAARVAKGGFPLVRRLTEYYRDASFDVDELEALVVELQDLRGAAPEAVDALIRLVSLALASDRGIQAICD